jgi:alkylation response protein AidB-like acyl-CoA dehydrogenase
MSATSERPAPDVRDGDGQRLLFADGYFSEQVEEFRARVAAVLRESVVPLVDEAEEQRRFPRAAIEALAEAGLMRERWQGGEHGDAGRGVVLAEELGRAGIGGIGVGISLHAEAGLSILRRFGRSEHLRRVTEGALDGSLICCVAATEDRGGSDLSNLGCTALREGDGWRVTGTKAFASLGAVADYALVLCATPEEGAGGTAAASQAVGAPLSVLCVPRDGFRVARRLKPVGVRGLETVRIEIDAHVGDDALVGRRGRGLFVGTWGLTHERFAAAATIVGGAQLGLALATTHLHRRQQFGESLYQHQALRLRLAEMQAQATMARFAVYALAGSLTSLRPQWAREAAGLKVVLAHLGERMASECMHVFGGMGYLEDRTPLSRWWRDVRVGRLGGGSDEMMLELVAGGLPVDDALYDELVETEW